MVFFCLISRRFIVEGKAVALAAVLKYNKCDCCCDGYPTSPAGLQGRNGEVLGISNGSAADEVAVTIGLFTIIKLFRLVNLTVESRGFCVPPECEEISPLNPCEFFDSLDFPFDLFSPPQIEDFRSNVNVVMSDNGRHHHHCGCES